jgi:predicted AAA+ superfamily ATPase
LQGYRDLFTHRTRTGATVEATIVSWDESREAKRGRAPVVPLWRWLLRGGE